MGIADCATAAIKVFPNVTIQTAAGALPYPVVMVAIGGAESGWNASAAGDYGLAGPACGGATSWGWLQVHSVHAAYLQQQTGSTSPCVWASWLYDPLHNAQAALALVGASPTQQGLANTWTTFAGGEWTAHIAAAQSAVTAAYQAAGGGTTGGTNPPPPQRTAALALGGLALAAVAVAAFEVGLFEWVAGAAQRVRPMRRASAIGGRPT